MSLGEVRGGNCPLSTPPSSAPVSYTNTNTKIKAHTAQFKKLQPWPKKKKKGVITLNPPVVWPEIALPTRGLKSVTLPT